MPKQTLSKNWFKIAAVLTSLVSIILSGTIFFRIIEGWSWIDSYFFTVVTLSTVGYGDLVPATPLGKIATTVLIFAGLGVFAYAIQMFGTLAVQRRQKQLALWQRVDLEPDDSEDLI